jgi:acetyl esterase/lipase
MGYSAGGHLALLYAYSTADNYANPNDNPIKLVISEAGPTYFTKNILENLPPKQRNEILAMVGAMTVENSVTKLEEVSPYTYATSASPYTILIYGGTDLDEDDIIDPDSNDTMIPYSQGDDLHKRLSPVGTTANSRLFSFEYPYTHESFGEDRDMNEDNIVDPGINPSNLNFAGYYGMIENKLKNL